MTSALSNEMIDEIERRCSAATPSPWVPIVEARGQTVGTSFIQTGGEDIYLNGATLADYDFIAAARQDIPALIAEVRLLREERATP
jgi:hypothetical protein